MINMDLDLDFESSHGNESESSTSTSQWSQQPSCRVFEFDEILLATDNFNESLVIGSGGFGKVYKGNVNIGTGDGDGAGTGTGTVDRVVAAIKRLDLMSSSQGAVEFWAEVEMLSKLRHAHLVSLIGYCNYERQMILIYEYMPHGTLEDHLHKLRTPLSWVERIKICIGAARGLDYLHTGTGIDLGVIHRDVKTSNILLHNSWAAKISDFGLSRIGPTNQPLTYVNTLVKGTFGYLDPNYFATGKLTRKSDVYAFGVVLFEVLCQKRPTDSSLEWGLATWAQDSIKEGDLKNIIDHDIRREISSKSLKEFAHIAQRCLDSHPKHRPTMTEVVFSLQSVLALQQKTNNLLHTSGKTVFERVIDVFPFNNSIGENSGVFAFLTKRKQLMLRKKFLQQNGTLLLEDKLKTIGVGSMKLFRVKELEGATQNYASNMIIGRGGYGTVYKGILRDNRVIAIKRSQTIDHIQLDQFVNELAILGQINHQHVVQLFGCCLETEVPLLVYEFVSNGTLYHYIHNENSGNRRLSWDSRLRIAHELARALAYLHTDTRLSIIHGDVKSSNILLDENLRVKIADFGVSKLVPLDHDRDATYTSVVGTLGYLDPEYLNSGQLTVKSDVYSFGVVLAELLTGKKSFSTEIDHEGRNLSVYFVNGIRENRMPEIIDHQVFMEATDEQLNGACNLACRCLDLKGENRPNMKEVAMELDTTRIGCEQVDPYDYPAGTPNTESEQDVDHLYDVSFADNSDNFSFGEYSSSNDIN